METVENSASDCPKIVLEERARCLRIVAKAMPELPVGEPVLYWNAEDWMKALRRAISKGIASGDHKVL